MALRISSLRLSTFNTRTALHRANSGLTHGARLFNTQGLLFPATRSFHTSLFQPNIPSEEYHQVSTRYRETTRDMLEELEEIEDIHREPVSTSDKVAFRTVKTLRLLSDMYFQTRYVERACLLETVAAVPGMVCGITHHFRALRNMVHCKHIKPTMDEAENERMHLMTFMEIVQPTVFQKAIIIGTQAAFTLAYGMAYILFPRTSHRFVGYLEEEAIHTYTSFLKAIDAGEIQNIAAPPVAIDYWGLPEDATLRDVVLVVRADEADHRTVNHHLCDLHDEQSKHGPQWKPCDEFRVDLESKYGEGIQTKAKPSKAKTKKEKALCT